MLGWIICAEGAKGDLQMRTICGVPFLTLEAPLQRRRRDRRRISFALRAMAKAGIRTAVVQGGVLPELEAFGIRQMDSSVLRMALLPQMLTWADRAWQLQLSRAAVVLTADVSDRTVWQAAELLGSRARYLQLDTGPGQAVMEDSLRRRWGIGIGGGRAVLEVCLGNHAATGLPKLWVGRNCACRQRLDIRWSGGSDMEEGMLCALFHAEKIPIEAIQLLFVEFRA
jgi:hypothetical protein